MSWIRRETEKGAVQYICPRCHDYHEFREDFGERTFSENYIFCRRCGARNGTGNAPTLTPPNEWVSVEEGMPKEHDSIFKELMGPDKWRPGMFERLSDDVIVAVKFADGTRRSGFARTKDGIWAGLPSIGCPVVTHWMPMPEPPDHRLPEKGRKTDGQ